MKQTIVEKKNLPVYGCFYSERNSMEDEFWKEQERLRREERIMRELEKEDE